MNILYKNLLREFDKFSLLKRILFARICNRSGIYFGQPPIIAYILDHDGCTQKDIADFLKVTPASIALSTKRLQKNGYIQKQPDEKNLRCNRLHLTPLGEKVIHEWKSGLDEVTEKMFAGFTDEELNTLCRYLERINDNSSEGKKIGSEYQDFIALVNEAKLTEKEGMEND